VEEGPEREGKQVRLVWPELGQVPTLFASEALGQVGSYGEILLTIGYASPPVLLGASEDELPEMLDRITEIQVRPLARYAFTRASLDRLIDALERTRDSYDRTRQTGSQADAVAEGEQDDGAET